MALAPALAGLVAALLCARSVANGFALDDRIDLVDNRLVTGPLDLGAIFTSEYYGGWGYMATGHYRPLLNLTYKAVAATFGLRPAPYHLLNVVLFALVVALTVHLVSRVASDRRTGVLAGLIFAVHPIVSESVAAIAGLKELAAAGLGLLAVRLYVTARESAGFAPRAGARRWTAPAAAALLAALLFKETALAFLPIAVGAEFLHHDAPRPRDFAVVARRVLRAWPLAASVAVVLAARAAVTGGLFRPTAVAAVDNPLVMLDAPFRALAALGLLARYLALFAWPACLSSDYSQGSFPLPASAADPWILASLALAAAIAAALAWAIRRGRRTVAFGLTAFAIAYLLVSNVVVLIGTIMAERLFFLPAWGLSVAAAGALVAIHDRWLLPGRPGVRVLAAAAVGVVLVALAARTWIRIGDWRDNPALADAVHRCYPGNVKVLVVLAEREAKAGRHDRARALYDRALSMGPDSSYAQAAMGVYLLERGEREKAVPFLEACAASRSPIPGPLLRLALLYLDEGRDDDAFRTATKALGSGPSYGDAATAHLVLGEVELRKRRPDDAAREYRQAVLDDPKEPSAHFNLGRVLEAQGRLEDALAELARAESLAPRDVRVLYAKAVVEAKLGRLDRSLETTDRLLAIDPGLAAAREHRAKLTLALGGARREEPAGASASRPPG